MKWHSTSVRNRTSALSLTIISSPFQSNKHTHTRTHHFGTQITFPQQKNRMIQETVMQNNTVICCNVNSDALCKTLRMHLSDQLLRGRQLLRDCRRLQHILQRRVKNKIGPRTALSSLVKKKAVLYCLNLLEPFRVTEWDHAGICHCAAVCLRNYLQLVPEPIICRRVSGHMQHLNTLNNINKNKMRSQQPWHTGALCIFRKLVFVTVPLLQRIFHSYISFVFHIKIKCRVLLLDGSPVDPGKRLHALLERRCISILHGEYQGLAVTKWS